MSNTVIDAVVIAVPIAADCRLLLYHFPTNFVIVDTVVVDAAVVVAVVVPISKIL